MQQNHLQYLKKNARPDSTSRSDWGLGISLSSIDDPDLQAILRTIGIRLRMGFQGFI